MVPLILCALLPLLLRLLRGSANCSNLAASSADIVITAGKYRTLNTAGCQSYLLLLTVIVSCQPEVSPPLAGSVQVPGFPAAEYTASRGCKKVNCCSRIVLLDLWPCQVNLLHLHGPRVAKLATTLLATSLLLFFCLHCSIETLTTLPSEGDEDRRGVPEDARVPQS